MKQKQVLRNYKKKRSGRIVSFKIVNYAILHLATLAVFLLLLASCTTINENKANLILDFSSPYGAKTLLPDIDMTPAGYDISGTGPNGDTFNFNNAQPPIMASNLEPGDWTITVNGKNSAGTIIAMGEQTTTLFPGQSQSVDITITPVEGYGSLDLTLFWTASDTIDPSITAELVPDTGSSIPLTFNIAPPGTAAYTGSGIPTGYYTLVVQLIDSGTLTMGAVEVVRVVDGQTTSGAFEFYDINQIGGSIQVNITPIMNDPITVIMSSQIAEFGVGGFMTVESSVPPETGNVVYVWYINGNSVATGASYTTPTDLAHGIYRMDVTAFTTDGSRAGAATHTFRVLNLEPVDVTLAWDPNTEPDLAGYNFYWGYASRDYAFSADVGNFAEYTVTGLIPGITYYFAVTAYDTEDLESDYSDEVVYTIPIP